METIERMTCPQCGEKCDSTDLFCTGCGALQPTMLFPGTAAVDVFEVPAEKHRSSVAAALKAWFPSIDVFAAERAMQQGRTRLISGIDEDSALRIIETLKGLKVIARPAGQQSSASRFFNFGLVVSALALIVAPWVDLLWTLLLIIVAVSTPVAVGLLKRGTQVSLVPSPHFSTNSEEWAHIAKDYSRVMQQLAPANARALQSIARGVFELQGGLSDGSLATVAAGGTSGEFAGKLLDILRSAVAIGERTLSDDASQNDAAVAELSSLSRLVDETRSWFAGLESGAVRKTTEITEGLTEVRSRIDSIVHEVRSVAPRSAGKLELE